MINTNEASKSTLKNIESNACEKVFQDALNSVYQFIKIQNAMVEQTNAPSLSEVGNSMRQVLHMVKQIREAQEGKSK